MLTSAAGVSEWATEMLYNLNFMTVSVLGGNLLPWNKFSVNF